MQEVGAAQSACIVRGFGHLEAVVVGTQEGVVCDDCQRLSGITGITKAVNHHLAAKEVSLAHVERLSQNFNVSEGGNVSTNQNADTVRRSPSSQGGCVCNALSGSHLLIAVVVCRGELELKVLGTQVGDKGFSKGPMVSTSGQGGFVDVAIIDSLTNNTLHQLELIDVVTTGQGVQNHRDEVVEGISVGESTSQNGIIDSNLVLVLPVAAVVHGLNVRRSRRQNVTHCRAVVGSSNSGVRNAVLHVSAIGDINSLENAKGVVIGHVVRFLKQNAVHQTIDELIHKGSVLHDSATSCLKSGIGSKRNVIFQCGTSLNDCVHNVDSSCHSLSLSFLKCLTFEVKSAIGKQAVDGVFVLFRSNRGFELFFRHSNTKEEIHVVLFQLRIFCSKVINITKGSRFCGNLFAKTSGQFCQDAGYFALVCVIAQVLDKLLCLGIEIGKLHNLLLSII
nr:MAG TPA: hypothetical protein [Caudoviricetes sp.]